MADESDTERLRIILELEAERAEKSAKSLERQIGALERRFDPLAKATQRYERDQRTLSRALEKGKIDADRYQKALDNVEAEYADAQAAAGRATQAINANSAANGRLAGVLSRNRSMFQQAGFQVQDFAVQVGSGTSAVTAFTQQGSQMLGIFGAYGAIAGAALAVGLPLAASFLKLGDEAEDAADDTDALTKATDAYVDAAEKARTPLDELRGMFGNLANEMLRVAEVQELLSKRQAENQLRGAASSVANQFGNLSRVQLELTGAVRNRGGAIVTPELDKFMAQTGLSRAAAEELAAALDTVERAKEPEQIAKAMTDLIALMDRLAGSADAAAEQFGDAYSEAAKVAGSAGAQAKVAFAAADKAASSYLRTIESLYEVERQIAELRDGLALAVSEGDAARVQKFSAALAEAEESYEDLRAAGGEAREEAERLEAEGRRLIETFGRVEFDGDQATREAVQETIEKLLDAIENAQDLDSQSMQALIAQLREAVGVADELGQSFTDASAEARAIDVYGTYQQSRSRGAWMSRSDGMQAASELIRDKEGFRETPYWDVNHYRAGYGSDTKTDPATGAVTTITQGMRVSIAEAEADLRRRIQTYFDAIIREIGQDRFDALSGPQKGSLASLLHNYGAGELRAGGDLGGVLAGLQSGRMNTVADEIARLGTHNGGINRGRRLEEASAFGGASDPVIETGKAEEAAAKEAEQEREAAAKKRAAELEREREAREKYNISLMESAERQELESSLISATSAERAEALAKFDLLNDAKQRGIDLDAEMAESGRTYRQVLEEEAKLVGELVRQKELQAEADKKAAKAAKETTLAQDMAKTATDQLSNGIADAIINGESFDDVLKSLAQTLLKMALNAAIQPLMNQMFAGIGGATPTTAPVPVTLSANGNVMTSSGPMPLRKYAKGGIANSPQLSIFGEGSKPEAYVPLPDGRSIPVTMDMPDPKAAQATNVRVAPEIHVHENAVDGPTETRVSEGGARVDVMLRKMVKEEFSRGGFDQQMSQRFGNKPLPQGV